MTDIVQQSPRPNRRGVLFYGSAFITAAMLVKGAVADPVFGMIERHRLTRIALNEIDSDHPDWDDRDETERAAWKDFAATVPKTPDGIRAYLHYANEYPDLDACDWCAAKPLLATLIKAMKA